MWTAHTDSQKDNRTIVRRNDTSGTSLLASKIEKQGVGNIRQQLADYALRYYQTSLTCTRMNKSPRIAGLNITSMKALDCSCGVKNHPNEMIN